MDVDLSGRVAWVAGGMEGRAQAITARLAASGALLYVAPRLPAKAAVAAMLRRFGKLDVLVNVDAAAPGALPLSQEAAEAMASQGGGRIVHIGSVAGLVPQCGDEERAAASASVFAFTRAMALGWARHNVLVNAIATTDPASETGAGMISHIPLRRVASDAEVANAALFLIAPASSYVTGHVLILDGGWCAGFARDF